MLKKIRFTNPIKECLEIQGKTYTISLIAIIAVLFALCIFAAVIDMPIASAVSGIVALGTTIFYAWWFGTKYISSENEEI